MANLRRFGRLRLRATGSSMLPAIAAGDVLVFHTCDAGALHAGQVVLFEQNGRLVVHRLASILPDGGLLTRGDALAQHDPTVDAEAILGVLVTQQRGGRQIPLAGFHIRKRQRLARWLIRRSSIAHRLLCRMPALARLAA